MLPAFRILFQKCLRVFDNVMLFAASTYILSTRFTPASFLFHVITCLALKSSPHLIMILQIFTFHDYFFGHHMAATIKFRAATSPTPLEK